MNQRLWTEYLVLLQESKTFCACTNLYSSLMMLLVYTVIFITLLTSTDLVTQRTHEKTNLCSSWKGSSKKATHYNKGNKVFNLVGNRQ